MPDVLAGRRIAVVGGTGFIGSHLTERLAREGAQVLPIAHTTSRLVNLAAVRHDVVVGICDIREFDAIGPLFRAFKPEIVYHLAAHPDAQESLRHMADCLRTNGLGLVSVLDAARQAGTELFVYGDSAKIYGNGSVPYHEDQAAHPICSYAITKSAGWQLCTLAASLSDLRVVSLRPTFVYGPRQNWNVISYVRQCVDSGRPIRLQGGTQTRDPLYIDDVIEAFVRAATSPKASGHAIPVGGGEEITVTRLCEAVVAALGAANPVCQDAERPRRTEIWRSVSDNADARRLLDWRPRLSLAEGLARLHDYWVGPKSIDTSSAACLRWSARELPSFRYDASPKLEFKVFDRRLSARDSRAARGGGRRVSDQTSNEQPLPYATAISEERL